MISTRLCMGSWKRRIMHFQRSLWSFLTFLFFFHEHDMPFMINDITGWAKIRAQLAVWARTLTLSPMTNPMAFVMISKSRVLILASQCLADVGPSNTTDSLAVKSALVLRVAQFSTTPWRLHGRSPVYISQPLVCFWRCQWQRSLAGN